MELNCRKIIELSEVEVYCEVHNIIQELTTKAGIKYATKLSGDITSRVIKNIIDEHMSEIESPYKTSDINAYIKGIKTEFDLLIVNRSAKPIHNTNCYEPKEVCGVLEIKLRGILGGNKDNRLDKTLQNINSNFTEAVQKCGIFPERCIYFTFQEVTPKKTTSINYLERTKTNLAPFPVVCLMNSRNIQFMEGEWKRFLDLLSFR